MQATVIVPVRDDDRVVECVRALLNQDYPGEFFDVIVVDNGSREPVEHRLAGASLLLDQRVKVMVQEDGGSYAARNAGVLRSTGSVIAFTDADCLPERQWLSAAVAAIEDGADIVAGRVKVFARDPDRPCPMEAFELVHAFPQERYVQHGGGCVCANMVTTRRVFDAAGPFPNRQSGADTEWAKQANVMGFCTRYVPDATVYHPARRTFGEIHSKLHRVITGKREMDLSKGISGAAGLPPLRNWAPPLGAFRRARQHPELTTVRARAALLVGEFWHRYAAALISTSVALRIRHRMWRSTGR